MFESVITIAFQNVFHSKTYFFLFLISAHQIDMKISKNILIKKIKIKLLLFFKIHPKHNVKHCLISRWGVHDTCKIIIGIVPDGGRPQVPAGQL